MDLGNKIKALRLKAGVTQEKVAQELGVSCQSVSKWENSVCAPDISLLPRLSIYFGVTIDELFDMTVDQKLQRIEHMLDFETVLSDEAFRETIAFLKEQQDTCEEGEPGRIYSLLAQVYHHRIVSDSAKVSDYARKALRLHPDLKQDQWLLQKAEGAAACDWSCRSHHKTILFYKELVKKHPEIARNYLDLLDNLLADHRTAEAKEYLAAYDRLAHKQGFQVPVYEARIALAEYQPEAAAAKLRELEEASPEDPNVLFEIAGFHANACRYDEAIRYYDKSYELSQKPRFYDALQGEALIYEIQGKYEEALRCWDRILQNLTEEWGIKEGAPLAEVEDEKQRIIHLVKNGLL